MKKKFRFAILLLTFALVLIPAMPVSALEDPATVVAAENSRLTITELNAAIADRNDMNCGTSYQFMEVVNTSDGTVDLSNYYIFRYGYDIVTRQYEWEFMKNIIQGFDGVHGARTVQKVRVTAEQMLLEKHAVALLWFCNDMSKTEADFRSYWKLTDDVAVAKIDITECPANKMTNNVHNKSGNGFLPLVYASCFVELVNGTVSYNGTNAANDDSVNNSNSALTKARHAAADCMAIFYTDYHDPANGHVTVTEDGSVSRHYYSYVDPDAYHAGASEFNAVFEGAVSQIISVENMKNVYGMNYVHGKPAENGNYAYGEGLKRYVSMAISGATGDTNHSGIFLDDGTHAAPTPGSLAKGQFGFVLKSPEGFGVQACLNGDGTYSVRFSATVDEEALHCAALGFDVTAVAIDRDGNEVIKKLNSDCRILYTSVYGKGEGVKEVYTQDDIKNGDEYFYLLTVNNISIEMYEDITFTVTPRVSVDGTEVLYGKSFTVVYNDGELIGG